MIKSISGQIKAKAALVDPNRYGRSDTSAMGRWFWEIDKVLLLLITVLIAIGLIAVAAASPAAAEHRAGAAAGHRARDHGDDHDVTELQPGKDLGSRGI